MYLRGLDGIRALAAGVVMIGHIHNATNPATDEDSKINGYAVTVFFALSGFLITFLLLKERQRQQINVKGFYLRRILRIWPLYFFYMTIVLIFIGTTLYPNILYYIFFLPNLTFVVGGGHHLLWHYWSLGVEEQFYAFWPWLIKLSKHVLLTLVAFLVSFLAAKIFVNLYFGGWSNIYSVVYHSRFDAMAVGGIGAVLYQQSEWVKKWLSTNFCQVTGWMVVALFLLDKFHIFSIIDQNILSAAVVVIIFGQIANDAPIVSLEHRWLKFIGKISFGIYVYHPLVIELALCSPLANINNPFIRVSLYYFAILTVSVFISYISYFYFEKFFLNKRQKYAPQNI